MIEKILSEKTLEELTQAIWEDCQKDIVKDITYAIKNEMRLSMSSRSSKLLHQYLDPLIKQELDNRLNELKEKIKTIVNNMFKRIEDVAIINLRYRCEDVTTNFFDKLAKEIAEDLKSNIRAVTR